MLFLCHAWTGCQGFESPEMMTLQRLILAILF